MMETWRPGFHHPHERLVMSNSDKEAEARPEHMERCTIAVLSKTLKLNV
jgi:hypothetical protein